MCPSGETIWSIAFKNRHEATVGTKAGQNRWRFCLLAEEQFLIIRFKVVNETLEEFFRKEISNIIGRIPQICFLCDENYF